MTDVSQELAEGAATKVREQGGEAWGKSLDVLDENQVETLLSEVVDRQGRVDVLASLAGGTALAPSIEFPIKEFDRILRLNVTGQFISARAAARRMVEQGTKGSIITIGSISSFGGIPRRAPYTASRAAIVNLTRTLAVEWAPHGIRVNCLAPTWTATEGLLRFRGQLNLEALEERIPMGRLAEPEEVASVAVFLASDMSSFVTGVTIPVDGGTTAYVGPGGKPSEA